MVQCKKSGLFDCRHAAGQLLVTYIKKLSSFIDVYFFSHVHFLWFCPKVHIDSILAGYLGKKSYLYKIRVDISFTSEKINCFMEFSFLEFVQAWGTNHY